MLDTKSLLHIYPYQRRLHGSLLDSLFLGVLDVLGGCCTDHSYAPKRARGLGEQKWPAESRRQQGTYFAAIRLCEKLHMPRPGHSTKSVFMHQFSDRPRPAQHGYARMGEY